MNINNSSWRHNSFPLAWILPRNSPPRSILVERAQWLGLGQEWGECNHTPLSFLPPTARSSSPTPMLLQDLWSQQLARGGEKTTAVLVWPLRGAVEARDLMYWPSAWFSVVCWETPMVNELVLRGAGRGNVLFPDWSGPTSINTN